MGWGGGVFSDPGALRHFDQNPGAIRKFSRNSLFLAPQAKFLDVLEWISAQKSSKKRSFGAGNRLRRSVDSVFWRSEIPATNFEQSDSSARAIYQHSNQLEFWGAKNPRTLEL